ncbi:MAG: creatininase family protein [Spirochaetota bacterium]
MKGMKGKLLSEMTWVEAAAALKENPIIVLPIGGGVKEHGHHLPLGTDMLVVDELARLVVRDAVVLLLPTLNYAYFPAFVDWPGSVSIGAETFKRFVADIIRSYARHGARKFLVLDGGVSTHYPMTILSYDLFNELGIEVAVTDIRGLGAETSGAVCEAKEGGHGDEGETSNLLALRPDLVHMDRAKRDLPPSPYATRGPTGVHKITLKSKMGSVSGINGDPSRASADKGRRILDAMASDIVTFLESFADSSHA